MKDAVLALSVLFAAGLAVSAPARRIVWLVVRNTGGLVLVVVAHALERRRTPTVRELPSGHAWRCTLYLRAGDRMHVLTGGVITGPWVTSAAVEAEVMARYVAARGYPAAGTLCCRAEPVAVAAG